MNLEHFKAHFRVNKYDLSLLLLRLTLCFIFLAHGAMDLTTDMEGTDAMMRGFGFPGHMAYVIGVAEILSAVMMLSGFLVAFAAWIQIVIDAFLILFIEGKNGFDMHNNGYEYTLLLLVCAIIVLLIGPGKFVLEKRWGHQAKNLREDGVESLQHSLGT